jgi:hypothetical protein
MSKITWISPAQSDLTIIPEGEFWPTALSVSGNTGPVTYKVISGALPPGIVLNESAGRLYGVPVVTNLYQDINDLTPDTLANVSLDVSRPYKFTIRAQDGSKLADRSFSLTITNIEPPIIIPRNSSTVKEVNLGSFLDGTRFVLPGFAGINDQILKFSVIESRPGQDITWSLISGELPNGLSIDSSGYLYGYLIPNMTLDDTKGSGWDGSHWQIYPWDFTGVRVEKTFKFTLQAYDGENFDQVTYLFTVVPRTNATADNGVITADTTTVPTDSMALHTPILLDDSYDLIDARQLSYFAYKFNAVDLDGDTIEYLIHVPGYGAFDENDGISEGGFDFGGWDAGLTYFPPTITLNSETGWVYGYFANQIEERKEVIFQISVRKVDLPEFESPRKTFRVPVLGNLKDLLDWNSPSDLGLINNGDISEFKLDSIVYEPTFIGVSNTSPAVDSVTYALDSGSLPSGLLFGSDGLIYGRAAFDYFVLDGGDTTIDKNVITFDSKYQFVANVIGANTSTGNILTSSTKEFTITVNNANPQYTDIYLEALPSPSQLATFNNIMGNTSIFSSDLIYRATDPHFGVNKKMKSLFLPGLKPAEAFAYAEAMQTNHYYKSILFGDIKTAVAVDDNFNVKYEVVYIELKDDLVNSQGLSPAVAQKLVTGNNTEASVYINAFNNMQQLVASRIGYNKKGALPDWMTSKQPNGKILGFVRCLVLCYLQPSVNKRNAETVALRLRNHLISNNIKFNSIRFIADRYILDTNLENLPDIKDKYIKFPKNGVFE